jgi:hypothetical protein
MTTTMINTDGKQYEHCAITLRVDGQVLLEKANENETKSDLIGSLRSNRELGKSLPRDLMLAITERSACMSLGGMPSFHYVYKLKVQGKYFEISSNQR